MATFTSSGLGRASMEVGHLTKSAEPKEWLFLGTIMHIRDKELIRCYGDLVYFAGFRVVYCCLGGR